jgi:hypothetical protein
MTNDQITNIAIKIGELQQKTDFSLYIAVISALVALVTAGIGAYAGWKLFHLHRQHEKQWAYVQKKSLIIDSAIEVFWRMIFNKLLVIHHNSIEAGNNLFLLNKDASVLESQMVVYGDLDIAEAMSEFRNVILNTPNDKFLSEWQNILEKGRECLLLGRKNLALNISERFEDFKDKLKASHTIQAPTKQETPASVQADTMGSVKSSAK